MKELEQDEAKLFLNELLVHYFSNGFQSLSKKDLDLLFFYLYYKYFLKGCSIYEISKQLKISPSKVKSLMLDSYLRWGKEDDFVSVKHILTKLANKSNIDYIIKNHSDILKRGKIPFLIESPIEKYEFENIIKKNNGMVGYERNREVITVDLDIFLKLIEQNFEPNTIKEIEDKFFLAIKSEDEVKDILVKKKITKIDFKDIRNVLNEFGYKIVIEVILRILPDIFSKW